MTIGKLLTAAVQEIAEKPEAFLQYLCTAAANEEQSFVNQLLILAQAPDSSVCASAEEWQACGCEPIPEKAIVLLDEENGETLRRLYVWNEESVRGNANKLKKWNLNPLFDAHEADALHKFCPLSAETLPDALLEAAEQGVEWKLEDTYDVFRQNTGREPTYETSQLLTHPEDLEKMDEEMDWLRDFLTAAVHFQLLVRCNYDPFARYSSENFALTAYCDQQKYPIGFLTLLSAIHEIAHDIFLYLRDIAAEFSELLPYTQKYGTEMKALTETSADEIIFPGENETLKNYSAIRLEHLQTYKKDEYLSYLMHDELMAYLVPFQEYVEDERYQITSSLIEQRGIEFEDEAGNEEIGRIADEIIRDEYLYS